MEETQYRIRKAKPSLPAIDLLPVISYNGRELDVAVFGPGVYSNNLDEMQKQYSHLEEFPIISFIPAITSESISIAKYGFGSKEEVDAKRDIFDPRWLQLGRIVRTSEGVYTNTEITNEKELKKMLNGVKEVNGIYLIDDKVGFAPYESFNQGVQDADTFAESGLARVLEHTEEKVAKNLREIASPKNYKRGVNVFGFDSVKEPVSKVASLYSGGVIDVNWLGVDGSDWYVDGCAFGVLNENTEGVSQNFS